MSTALPRVVLDTNVCLDLFVFDDPRVAALRSALQQAQLIAVSDAACREEWRRVLTYPQWQLDADRQRSLLADFDAAVQFIAAAAAPPAALPRCRDPDDQKFLELAAHAQARWLLSRDDHLLTLNRRAWRDHHFEILTPQAWAAQCAAAV